MQNVMEKILNRLLVMIVVVQNMTCRDLCNKVTGETLTTIALLNARKGP